MVNNLKSFRIEIVINNTSQPTTLLWELWELSLGEMCPELQSLNLPGYEFLGLVVGLLVVSC